MNVLVAVLSKICESTYILCYQELNFFSQVLQFLTGSPPGSFCFLTLSPAKLPSPAKQTSKFSAICNEMLLAEEKEEDHPDVREIRRRVAANLCEMVQLGHI